MSVLFGKVSGFGGNIVFEIEKIDVEREE